MPNSRHVHWRRKKRSWETPFLRPGEAGSWTPCSLTWSQEFQLLPYQPLLDPALGLPTPHFGSGLTWLWDEIGDLILYIGDFPPSFSHTFESFRHFCLTHYRPTFLKKHQTIEIEQWLCFPHLVLACQHCQHLGEEESRSRHTKFQTPGKVREPLEVDPGCRLRHPGPRG